MEGEPAHDAGVEPVLGGGPGCYDGAGAFVRGGYGEGGAEGAGLDHGVGVAVGGDGYFDEEVVGTKGGGDGDGDGVDLVGLVEGDHLGILLIMVGI